jgi:hypothetical protein
MTKFRVLCVVLGVLGACSEPSGSNSVAADKGGSSAIATNAPASSLNETDFCTVWATGNDSEGNVVFGERSSSCASDSAPMLFNHS